MAIADARSPNLYIKVVNLLRFLLNGQGIPTDPFHLTARHSSFAESLNVVILLKTNLKNQQQAHVILFSSDLALDAHTLIKYYSLRFQIELNFRDAKQL